MVAVAFASHFTAGAASEQLNQLQSQLAEEPRLLIRNLFTSQVG
jgi:hypothetical protein